MLTIGLTGGIGSGKSTISEIFSELGTPCCDADGVGRSLTQIDSPALHEIVDAFGDEILDSNGQLDRRRLRHTIFSAPEKRLQLEAILHPRIRQQIQRWISEQTASYGLVSVPLLIENQDHYHFDRVLVAKLDDSLQRQRTSQRDQVSHSDIQAIMANQASDEQRLAIADDIIDNNGDLNALRLQIFDLHTKYLSLAKSKANTAN